MQVFTETGEVRKSYYMFCELSSENTRKTGRAMEERGVVLRGLEPGSASGGYEASNEQLQNERG